MNTATNSETQVDIKNKQLPQNTAPSTGTNMANQNRTNEIDLVELFLVLLGHWRLLIIALALGALLGGVYHHYTARASYKSTASIYMTNSDSVLSMVDLQISTVLTEDYANILLSRTVLNKVIEDQGLNINYRQLQGMIKVENPESTRILKITVTASDPQLSRDIANSLINVGIDQIYMIIGSSMPNIVDVASAESVSVVYSSFTRTALMGALIAFVLVCLIIMIIFLMDTSIKSEEDIEKYLQLPVLGAIPEYDSTVETVSRLSER